MNLTKAKSYLNKINRLFGGIEEDGGNVSPIERDLMLAYVREFYDSFLHEPTPEALRPTSPTPPIQKTRTIEPKVRIEEPKPEKPVQREIRKPIVEKRKEPVIEPTPVSPKPPQPKYEVPRYETAKVEIEQPKVEPRKVEPPVQHIAPTPVAKETEPPVVKVPKVEQIVASDEDSEYNALFEEAAITALSQRLGQSKIKNLRASMGINERFLIQNELFGGNSNQFNEALDKLDGYSDFLSAKNYIIQELAPKHNWLDEKHQNRAKAFIQKIRRRYKVS